MITLFSVIFGVLSFGLFLALFLLEIEHPKKWHYYSFIMIGASVVALTPLRLFPFIIIGSGVPVLYLFSSKYELKNRLLHLGLFLASIFVLRFILVPYVPFYIYPFLMAIFLFIVYLRNGVYTTKQE